MSFESQIDSFVKKTIRNTETTIENVVTYAYNEIKTTSPVFTQNFKASTRVALDGADKSFERGFSDYGTWVDDTANAPNISVIKSISGTEDSDVFISNNVPYARDVSFTRGKGVFLFRRALQSTIINFDGLVKR